MYIYIYIYIYTYIYTYKYSTHIEYAYIVHIHTYNPHTHNPHTHLSTKQVTHSEMAARKHRKERVRTVFFFYSFSQCYGMFFSQQGFRV